MQNQHDSHEIRHTIEIQVEGTPLGRDAHRYRGESPERLGIRQPDRRLPDISKPVYVKVSRQLLDENILRYYDLPWEIDPVS
jgi:hypothetical protein